MRYRVAVLKASVECELVAEPAFAAEIRQARWVTLTEASALLPKKRQPLLAEIEKAIAVIVAKRTVGD